MDYYFNNSVSKLLIFFALIIVVGTLWYTNNLANQFKIEEKKKVALWAKATKELSDINTLNYDVSFVFEVVNNNTTVPVIQVNNQGRIIAHRNMGDGLTDQQLKNEINLMKRKYPPIEIELIDGTKEYLYYKDSKLLQQLRYFPFWMILIVSAFMLIAYFAFSSARVAQQNKVWTGMAKETAHQIGTPLSSLIGWLEYLKDQKVNQSVTREIQKDIDRLTIIASRFSKIGSLPKLDEMNIVPIIQNSIVYMKKRVSSKVNIELSTTSEKISALINVDLFEWVVENIIKNSVDAIKEDGKISLVLTEKEDCIFLDFVDNGKGISKSIFREVFKPGFTSKKIGWGLGLSLVKRIVEDYHRGRVKIIKSIPYHETVVRIVLNT